jgi:delta-aminolevulinic acid dehydratase/porphobilinogen synthase
VSQQRRHRIRKELAQSTAILSFSAFANHCYEPHKREVKNSDVSKDREMKEADRDCLM